MIEPIKRKVSKHQRKNPIDRSHQKESVPKTGGETRLIDVVDRFLTPQKSPTFFHGEHNLFYFWMDGETY
ncbi:hypothetical protein OEV98_15030 [Caldibacillus lycopersici]|uniref:Uncharacterized protein n=1 Tax=Perspicuibacillus lycopersici TaxID=1325689 RepID=A0AAE3IWU8_9BACI|nr:hypothetical protein [Perspicuibacillus lycopersici]MCU9614856.1 hypothetical protein [Perspicuibacillus lycopersici]